MSFASESSLINENETDKRDAVMNDLSKGGSRVELENSGCIRLHD